MEEPGEDDDANEVAEVEAGGGGVEAAVGFEEGRRGGFEGSGSKGVEEAPLFEDLDYVVGCGGAGVKTVAVGWW